MKTKQYFVIALKIIDKYTGFQNLLLNDFLKYQEVIDGWIEPCISQTFLRKFLQKIMMKIRTAVKTTDTFSQGQKVSSCQPGSSLCWYRSVQNAV